MGYILGMPFVDRWGFASAPVRHSQRLQPHGQWHRLLRSALRRTFDSLGWCEFKGVFEFPKHAQNTTSDYLCLFHLVQFGMFLFNMRGVATPTCAGRFSGHHGSLFWVPGMDVKPCKRHVVNLSHMYAHVPTVFMVWVRVQASEVMWPTNLDFSPHDDSLMKLMECLVIIKLDLINTLNT